MNVIVDNDGKITSGNSGGTQNENNVKELVITVPDQYQDFNKKIVFIIGNKIVWDVIEGDKYLLTRAVTQNKSVTFYIWLTKDDMDFRSQEHTLTFNINHDCGTKITQKEIDGVATVVNILEGEITKVSDLEKELQDSEAIRIENEEERKTKFAEMQAEQTAAVNNIIDMTNQYNANATAKTEEYNTHVSNKIDEFNANATTKANQYNTNAIAKTETFNTNATAKTEEYNINAQNKLNEYKTNEELLMSQIPHETITDKAIHVEDSSNLPCRISPIGASIQEGTPSIDSEAPIESVGDNINLFNLEDGTNTMGGVTRVIEKGEITLNGTPNDNYYNLTIGSYTSQKTEIYTLMPFKSSTNANIRLLYQLNGGNFVSNDSSQQIEMNKDDVLTVNLRIDSTDTISNFKLKPKLVKGTSTGAYSPYGQGSIEIYNCNENLLNKDNLTIGNNVYGNVGENVSYAKTDLRYCIIPENAIECKPNNGVTMFINNSNYSFSLAQLDENKKFISDSGWKTGVYSIKTSSTTKYLVCNIRKADNSTVNIDELKKQEIQLEKGETATEYVEGKSQTKALYTQQPFRAIGDVKDRFVKVDGVWYEEHDIPRLVLDGTEAWQVAYASNTSEKYQSYELKLNDIESSWSSANTILCTHFKNVVGNVVYAKIGIGICSDMNNNLIICTDILTLDEFKSKLAELYEAGTPLYVDYQLATPTLIECTPEQVEVLESFNTYKNVTNISSDSIGELEVFYYKDLETFIYNAINGQVGQAIGGEY